MQYARGEDGDYHRSPYERDPYYGEYTDDYGDGYPYYDPQYQPSPNPEYSNPHQEPQRVLMPMVSKETAPAEPARITVVVPADAKISVDDTSTVSTGTYRCFKSPPLDPGNKYSYKFVVRWHEAGKEMAQTQRVNVTSGAKIDLRFPKSSDTGRETSNSLPQPRQLVAK
jgi:uncharacterized protein (TIGR03000 family)